MKLCRTCGSDTRRGWSNSAPPSHSIYCLVCKTARIMASFVWPKGSK